MKVIQVRRDNEPKQKICTDLQQNELKHAKSPEVELSLTIRE